MNTTTLERAVERLAATETAALLLLRCWLAIVFIWAGALMLAGAPTLTDGLASATVRDVDPAVLIPLLGGFEILLGAGLLAGRRIRLVAAAAAANLTDTLGFLMLRPDVAFQQGNPRLPTIEGEFVIKNPRAPRGRARPSRAAAEPHPPEILRRRSPPREGGENSSWRGRSGPVAVPTVDPLSPPNSRTSKGDP
jgi:uncharacterized membrane protein YphA (DoxX/SURF4 family)